MDLWIIASSVTYLGFCKNMKKMKVLKIWCLRAEEIGYVRQAIGSKKWHNISWFYLFHKLGDKNNSTHVEGNSALISNWQGGFPSQLSWRNIIGVSRTTLLARCRELQLDWFVISVEQLTALSKMSSQILEKECWVTFSILITSICQEKGLEKPYVHQVDPINVSLHRSEMLHRCQYSVPGPNSLWHLGEAHDLFILTGQVEIGDPWSHRWLILF